mmetsp:Transcript_115163/g.215626  ORF Transcript_115163/g.215626 Transcript_115163/m.215626 type:complete len:167 (+) Transcript_115163:1283-1783(+)
MLVASTQNLRSLAMAAKTIMKTVAKAAPKTTAAEAAEEDVVTAVAEVSAQGEVMAKAVVTAKPEVGLEAEVQVQEKATSNPNRNTALNAVMEAFLLKRMSSPAKKEGEKTRPAKNLKALRAAAHPWSLWSLRSPQSRPLICARSCGQSWRISRAEADLMRMAMLAR